MNGNALAEDFEPAVTLLTACGQATGKEQAADILLETGYTRIGL